MDLALDAEQGNPDPENLARMASHLAAGLRPGWVVLQNCHLGDSSTAPVRFALMHPEIGVALLDLAPALLPDAIVRLRQRLDDARFASIFPGHLPIIHRALAARQVRQVATLIDYAFAMEPRLSLPGGGAWTGTVRRALYSAPAMVTADPARMTSPTASRRGGAPIAASLRNRRSLGVLACWALLVGAIGTGGLLLSALGPPPSQGAVADGGDPSPGLARSDFGAAAGRMASGEAIAIPAPGTPGPGIIGSPLTEADPAAGAAEEPALASGMLQADAPSSWQARDFPPPGFAAPTAEPVPAGADGVADGRAIVPTGLAGGSPIPEAAAHTDPVDVPVLAWPQSTVPGQAFESGAAAAASSIPDNRPVASPAGASTALSDAAGADRAAVASEDGGALARVPGPPAPTAPPPDMPAPPTARTALPDPGSLAPTPVAGHRAVPPPPAPALAPLAPTPLTPTPLAALLPGAAASAPTPAPTWPAPASPALIVPQPAAPVPTPPKAGTAADGLAALALVPPAPPPRSATVPLPSEPSAAQPAPPALAPDRSPATPGAVPPQPSGKPPRAMAPAGRPTETAARTPPPRPASPSVLPEPAAGSPSSRCRAITIRLQLGEEPTDAERTLLRSGCGTR